VNDEAIATTQVADAIVHGCQALSINLGPIASNQTLFVADQGIAVGLAIRLSSPACRVWFFGLAGRRDLAHSQSYSPAIGLH
jgi:hypothetical protein